MTNTAHPRGFAGFFLAAMLLAYLTAAGLCAIYAMLATLYRVYADPQLIGWTLGAYFLVAAGATAACGRLGDLVGRRRTVIVVLVLGFAGALLGALSQGLGGIVAGCALVGMLGSLMPLSMGLVRDALPPNKVPLVIGVLMAVSQGGSGVAIFVAGAMIDHYLIAGGFWQLAAIIALALACMLIFVPGDKPQEGGLQGVNLPLGLLFSPAIAGIFIAMQLGREHGWSDPVTLLVLVASLLVLAWWARYQMRAANPLINVRSLATRQVGFANLIAIIHALGALGVMQIGSMLLQQPEWTGAGYGLSATTAGLLMLLFATVAIAGGPWSGHISTRRGSRFAALAGSVVILASWIGIALLRDFWFFVAFMVTTQLGISIMYPAVFNLVVEATPPDRTSEATGVTVVVSSAFMGVGSQVMFKLLATASAGDAARGSFPAESAYALTFGYIILMSVLAIIVAWALPHRTAAAAAPGHVATH